jgi:hypothetical protein
MPDGKLVFSSARPCKAGRYGGSQRGNGGWREDAGSRSKVGGDREPGCPKRKKQGRESPSFQATVQTQGETGWKCGQFQSFESILSMLGVLGRFVDNAYDLLGKLRSGICKLELGRKLSVVKKAFHSCHSTFRTDALCLRSRLRLPPQPLLFLPSMECFLTFRLGTFYVSIAYQT